MIHVRVDEQNAARLVLVLEPPAKRDAGLDPAVATDWLFSILGAAPAMSKANPAAPDNREGNGPTWPDLESQ